MTIFDFMDRHWIVTLLLAMIASEVVRAPFKYAFRAYNRRCRAENIAVAGWPPAHLDADGDPIKKENSK